MIWKQCVSECSPTIIIRIFTDISIVYMRGKGEIADHRGLSLELLSVKLKGIVFSFYKTSMYTKTIRNNYIFERFSLISHWFGSI